MKRRIILVTCLLGVIGGSAGAALAQPPTQVKNHDVCIAFAQNENYNAAKYLCIDTP